MSRQDSLPCSWRFGLIPGMIGCGVILFYCNPSVPERVHLLSSRIRPDAWSSFAGIYLASLAIGHIVTFHSSRALGNLLKLQGKDTAPDLWSPALVGIVEGIMYPASLLMGKGEFIGVWLAIKAAGQWNRWGANVQGTAIEEKNEPRRRYNRFLIGNALSIISGIVTYGALKIWTFA